MSRLARLAISCALLTGLEAAPAHAVTLFLNYYNVTLVNSDATTESGTGSVSFQDGLITIGPGELTAFSFQLNLDGPSGSAVIAFGRPDLGSFTAAFDPGGSLTALTFYTYGKPSRYAINGDPLEDVVVNGLGPGQASTGNGVVVSFGDFSAIGVPEPAAPAVIGLGLAGVAASRRRRARAG